jgi:protein-S-isoprenylcysteine O-methyltransferase Ste14
MKQLHNWLFGGAWLAFILYWFISASWTAKTKMRDARAERMIYLLIASVAAGLLLLRGKVPSALGGQLWPQNEFTFFAGALLLLSGLGFALWARVHLGEFWSSAVTLKEGHRLIRTGPYALVRHPIYTGILMGIAGTVTAIGQVRAVLAFVLLCVIFRWKSRREERLLAREFGMEYLSYMKDVRALVPLPRCSKPSHSGV